MSTVKITRKDFTQKVEEGWKRQQLMEHYGIRSADVTTILKELGLKIRKFHKPRFVLVDDEDVAHTVTSEDVANNPEGELVEGEQIEIPENSPKEEKPTRKRRTKAEIEADKAKEAEVQEEVEVEEDTQTEEIKEEEVEIDVMKATENVETSFNIPSGANSLTPSKEFDSKEEEEKPVQNPDNPFLKAWGNNQ